MIRYAYQNTRTEMIVLCVVLFIAVFFIAIIVQNIFELLKCSKEIEELEEELDDFELIEGEINIGDYVYDTHYGVSGTYCGVDDRELGILLIVQDEKLYYLHSVLDNLQIIN